LKTLAPLPLFLIAACSSTNERSLAEAPYCEETRTPLVDVNASTELGFSVNDMLGWGAGEFHGALTWSDGASPTTLAVTGTSAGTAEWVASEAVYPDNGGQVLDIAVICEPRVEIPITAAIQTDDGRFAETGDLALSGTLTSDSAGSASATIPFDTLAGTLDIAAMAPEAGFDTMEAEIAYTATGAGVSEGTVSAGFSYVQECDETEDCTASYASVEIGTWVTPAVE